jgi:hypothetical protein
MSLINEALKKAQREGNGKDAPAARNPDVTSATQNGRKPGLGAIAGGVVALLAVAGGVGYYLTQDEPKAEVASAVPAPKVEHKAVAETPAVAKPVESSVTPAVPSPEVKPAGATPFTGEVAKPAEVVTKVETPVAVNPVDAPVTPVTPVIPPVPVTPSAPVQNPEITEMIGRMKVSLGRKKTGRCVIDSVVFKVGDQLSASPAINIKSVTDTEVVFSDVNGVEYAKKYK